MNEFLKIVFTAGPFIPHGHCYLWKPSLVGLHVSSDALIALAYYSIPLTLFYFVRKRTDLPFNWIFLLFAAFIVACGTTHLAEIWTLWHPTYWVSGWIKALTAGVSIPTAVLLVSLVPQALALPSPAQLRQANQQLQAQIQERQRVEEELRQTQSLLEQRVQERTAELVKINERLRQEIAERQRTEEALRENQAKLVLAHQIGKIGACEWNFQTGSLIWTEEMEALYGLLPGTFEGRYESWIKRLHPDDRLDMHDTGRQLTTTVGADFDREFRIVLPDGSLRWLAGRARVFHDDAGNPCRLIGVNMDITDRKQAELALETNLAQLEAVINCMTEGLVVVNTQGQVLLMNPAALRIHGFESEDEVKQPVQAFTQCIEVKELDEQLVEPIDWPIFRALSGETFSGRRLKLRRTDTGKCWIAQYGGTPVRNKVGELILAIVTVSDITAQYEAEETLRATLEREQVIRAQAETANRVKDEFLAILSHELRTPLNPILGWVTLLKQGNLDENKKALGLATIERNAKLQTQLIEDLLDISRILQGKLAFNPSPVDLGAVIGAAIETIQLSAKVKSIQIETRLNAQMGQVMGDAGRLQQVIWNLLSNAVKFTPAGGRVEIELASVMGDGVWENMNPGCKKQDREPGSYNYSAQNYAQITVQDNGRGISPEFLPYVFDTFRQADSATTRQFGGLGLGLAIVRHIVELHGGFVQVDSPGEGQGATFIVRLPLLPLAVEVKPPQPKLNSWHRLAGKQALLVDDDRDSREILSLILEQHGVKTITVASAQEALQVLNRCSPDFLLCDIAMPDVDGYSLIHQIRTLPVKQGAQIPAIAITAYSGANDRQRAIQAGFQNHLSKPIEAEKLLQAIVELTKVCR